MTARTTRTRRGAAFFVVLLLMLAGVVLARSQSQPQSRLASTLTFGEFTPVPFEQAEAASTVAPWFRITFGEIRADQTGPSPDLTLKVALAPPAVEVPGTVQNLHRVDQQ
jgi:hypothetical protein